MRVLVCDDDAAVLVLLGVALADVELLEASRCGEAAGLAEDGHFDAAVIDRHLPDGDGLDVVRAIRRAPKAAEVPIVVLAAGLDPTDVEAVLAAGADECLGKPFEPEALGDLLHRLVLLPDQERVVRRTVRRARAKAGSPSAGWDDLPAFVEAEVRPQRKGRLSGRRRR